MGKKAELSVVNVAKIMKKIPYKIRSKKMRELKDDMFYSPTQFAELRGCSVPTALSIYNSKDFPSENYGKEKVALGSAIREWYRAKRNKEE